MYTRRFIHVAHFQQIGFIVQINAQQKAIEIFIREIKKGILEEKSQIILESDSADHCLHKLKTRMDTLGQDYVLMRREQSCLKEIPALEMKKLRESLSLEFQEAFVSCFSLLYFIIYFESLHQT